MDGDNGVVGDSDEDADADDDTVLIVVLIGEGGYEASDEADDEDVLPAV